MKKRMSLNQLPLPFLSQRGVQSRVRSISIDDRARAFWFLAGALIFALGAYVYAVNATAHHVAERASLEREATDLNAALADLEFQSIALKNDITLEVARAHGFEEVEQPLYVAKKSAASLSLNTTR
jgi:hypothetical protein